jgi:RNA polymerase sigma factor (sigma-70 family)
LSEEKRPPQGFEDFYETNFSTVARAVRLTVNGPDEAADIAQEAFVRTWAHWGRIGRREKPVLFTLRVARNLATSRVRQLIRYRRAIARLHTAGDRPPDVSPGVGMEVREALAELPHRQRWAVVLCDLVGLSSPEAARIVGISPSTLRVHLARAREHLRAAFLEQEAPDELEAPGQRRLR